MKRSKKIFLFFILLIIVIIFGLFLYLNSPFIHWKYANPNREQLSRLKTLELSLDLYRDKKGSYPVVGSDCQEVSILKQYLIPEFLGERDAVYGYPANYANPPRYFYANSPDGRQFVLKTLLTKDSSALKNDLDGTILGCNCDDPNYCTSGSN
ncbi:MAG: hypothetical protein A3G49_05635 [Candidatus Sungbacteria bacterium RIFCSPLOWO2_12_FULL_41_11]|uniref:Type II secretion system protein GspG C-terminal domain-containing protein n=1 Tax=Candidatus Sungbacteria bacterium RIFCSPLOWO2_12_FULL_41_11 TaxID=1802286 RepID=A0A1G2LSL3_9BACT|nr:MAG: hypothetical protein UV01_C0008G0028 [Parcubacteria group bacterium GW2011_GWA2_42_14]OGZ99204.1 MAG: hypothetical protein A3D41_02795 [Candidatus Sungbacteria bacterium RIFCSPHIGHO2_02_FULL_41_12b]OHA14635.1 MAG: hypothetical protein A3G49_05635 [Candidatus Sungbacteria bacterium RIFCSPLOWO2_12_FULL_41_11]